MLFLVSVVPVFLLVKSLLFKRSAGAKAAVSNFSRQVGNKRPNFPPHRPFARPLF